MRAALLITGCLLSSLAFADIPPDPKYVETCTVKKQQKKGETCQSCGTYFREATKCKDFLGARGYTKRCQTAGASTWSEVWCQKGENLPDPLSVSPTKTPEPPVPEVKTPEPTTKPAEPEAVPESQPEANPQPAPAPPTTVKQKPGACAVAPDAKASSGVFLLGVFVGLFGWRRRTQTR